MNGQSSPLMRSVPDVGDVLGQPANGPTNEVSKKIKTSLKAFLLSPFRFSISNSANCANASHFLDFSQLGPVSLTSVVDV